MGMRGAWVGGILALALSMTPALAQVGQSVGHFEKSAMIKQGMIAYLEPFELKDGTKGKTYRATPTYFQACQIMLITRGTTIDAEIFAMPLIDSEEVMQAEKILLDGFLGQSGMSPEAQDQARQQFIDAIGKEQTTRKHGQHYVQTTLLPAEVPLLVMAIARESSKLPFKESKTPKTQGPSAPTSTPL